MRTTPFAAIVHRVTGFPLHYVQSEILAFFRKTTSCFFFKQGQDLHGSPGDKKVASKMHTLTISPKTVTRGIILSKYILRNKLALLADPAPNQPSVSKTVLTNDDLMINKEK